MLQIDGLPHRQLLKALAAGEMPFLQRLIETEHYQLHNLYAGVPSTTPAAQGELFYAVKTAVPSFNFKPHGSPDLVRMFEPGAVTAVEDRLQSQCQNPLLSGGSCYADNFSGGAAETHFSPSSLGWGTALRESRPLVLLLLIVSHSYSFLRCAALMLLETALAIIDFTRGLFVGHNFWAELKFVPSRVLIVILLRELITIGAKIDIARGLPIIHLNFLGYDEQAHRRGPTSLFAHWTLLGIDDAIARIWRATQRANRRSYDLWIYSDHGQEEVMSYQNAFSQHFSDAASAIFTKHLGCAVDCQTTVGSGIQLERIRMLGGKLTQAIFAKLLANLNNNGQHQAEPESEKIPRLSVAALGPVAHLYFNRPLSTHQRSSLARALCVEAGVPAVLYLNSAGVIRARRANSEYNLQENPSALLGTDHPYPTMVYDDLKRLCSHPDAGVLIACGQYPDSPDSCKKSFSFAIENGAHGGWSRYQIDAFALLPKDINLQAEQGDCPRMTDLRRAALAFLQPPISTQASSKKSPRSVPITANRKTSHSPRPPQQLRIMTYNVHSCIGMDGKLAPERIARLIARHEPDIVALQEIDVGRVRTDSADQAQVIADHLGMDVHFHGALHLERERFGDAVLTHLPMRLIKAADLPRLPLSPTSEPRGALWVEIKAFGKKIQFINTHLSLRGRERRAQVESLLSRHWLGHPKCQTPTILCGDFNLQPNSREWQTLNTALSDVQNATLDHIPQKTFASRLPTLRIDHIFIDNALQAIGVQIPNNALARVASDHLPLIADIRLLGADQITSVEHSIPSDGE